MNKPEIGVQQPNGLSQSFRDGWGTNPVIFVYLWNYAIQVLMKPMTLSFARICFSGNRGWVKYCEYQLLKYVIIEIFLYKIECRINIWIERDRNSTKEAREMKGVTNGLWDPWEWNDRSTTVDIGVIRQHSAFLENVIASLYFNTCDFIFHGRHKGQERIEVRVYSLDGGQKVFDGG